MEPDHAPAPAQEMEGLCYLPAENVESPAGTLADLELCDRDDQTVGRMEGVLIDAPARRVRYFVVRPASTRACNRFLLPVETIVHVECDNRIARLDTSAEDHPLVSFDPQQARPFSDEDALDAMFRSHAA